MKRHRTLYTVLSMGAIGVFLGHGAFAVMAKDSFIKLFTGSFKHVLGITVSAGTADTWVRAIGYFDLAVTAVFVAMLVGNIARRGPLYQLAYSRVAVALFSWGAFWGFVTAASRMTAVGHVFPEFWDLVERAPNFMLPAAMVLLIHHYRYDHRPVSTGETAETVLSAR